MVEKKEDLGVAASSGRRSGALRAEPPSGVSGLRPPAANAVRFTPGPWQINPAAKDQIMAEGDCQILARVPSGDTGLYNRHAPANARLIAAAPDLFEALAGCVKRLRNCALAGGNDPEMVDILCEQFEVPLRRARGEGAAG